MLSPLQWEANALARTDERAVREAFRWPTPPAAGYAPPCPQTDPLECEIVGHNDTCRRGRLTFFVPEEGVAHVQVLPARTTMPLRFEQFRALRLVDTLPAEPPRSGDPHAELLAREPLATYRLHLLSGGEWALDSIGHLETDFGLFLFPPVEGGVQRLFLPRQGYSLYEIGPRIGLVLLEQESVSAELLDEAIQEQGDLRERKLGDVLLERHVVSPAQLDEALEHQARMPMVRIGEALRSLNMIDEAQLGLALQQQQSDRSLPLGEVLVRMGAVSRSDLQIALARKMGFPLVDVDAFPIEVDALRKLRFDAARRLEMLPLLVRSGRLIVALDDPVRRRAAVEEAEFIAQLKVVPVIAFTGSIDAAIAAAYQRIGSSAVLAWPDSQAFTPIPAPELTLRSDALVETLEREDAGRGESEKPIEQSDNSLVRLINTMIIEAINDGVSDVHVEAYPGREKIRIRFRKDGLMRTYLELPHTYRSAVVARLKIMCDLDTSERRKPQDGKINFAKFSAQHRVELRVATIPTNNGLEDVVMRILGTARPLPLDRLGLSEWNYQQLRTAIERPYGLVLCVGPTGSGKTTTLHSALSHINVPERKIWTAEDPIEITQPGLRQVQVNPRIDWTFAKALRALLRADPDAMMIGEIRDTETAQIAIEASLTGHLVMSTLHTNGAPETVTRLLDMGLDPFNFADALLAVLAQRLVRRYCTECLSSRPATAAEVDEWLADHLHAFADPVARPSPDAVLAGWQGRHARDGRLMASAAPGCPACSGTGFKGRLAIHELMVVSRELRRMVQTGERAAELQRVAMAEGMRTLRQDGIDKVLAGLTSIEEVRATSNG